MQLFGSLQKVPALSMSLQPVTIHIGRSWAKLPPAISAQLSVLSKVGSLGVFFSAGNWGLKATLYSCVVQTKTLPWEKICP